MAYISQEEKKSLTSGIKVVLQKYKLSGSLSIRHHSTLVLTIKHGKLDIIGNYNENLKERNHRDELIHAVPIRVPTSRGYMEVNTYWAAAQYTGQVKECIMELIAAMKIPGWRNKTDISTDCFDISYYIDIQVGKWNKPYIVQ